MRFLLRFLFLAVVVFAQSAQAEWEYDFQATASKANYAANQLANEVSQLPEPLFMSGDERARVQHLLAQVLAEQSKQILVFESQLHQYRQRNSDVDWSAIESSYLTLNSLSLSKQRLLQLASEATREQLTGFGPYGVKQVKQEWQLTQLNAEYLLYFQLRSFKSLLSDLLISPIPVIWAALKVFFFYLVLTWWLTNSQRLISTFHQTQIKNRDNPALWIRIIWYLSRANQALAWLITITLSLQVLSQIPSLQHLIVLEIFTWWILGGSIAVSFILEFVSRSSRSANKEVTALRLSTIRRYVWSTIIAGVILQISMRTLGKGTIYYWINSALFFWFVLVTISVLQLWREKVFTEASKLNERPLLVAWAISKKDSYVLRVVATAITAIWLLLHTLKHKLISALSEYTFFSQALAYLFRIEVAKQTGNANGSQNLVRIKGEENFNYVLPGSIDSELIDYAGDEIKQLSKYLMTDSPAVCVVSGERGVGTTTLLYTLLHRVKNAEPIYLSCPYSGFNELLSLLALNLGLEEDASEIQVLAYLRKSEVTYFIAVDNAQRLVKPMVGGLSGLIRLTNLLRRSKKNHRVVMAIAKASWRFVDRARGERLLFDWVSFLPRWNEKQIQQLLDSRINRDIETPISFEGLVVPKQWDQEEITEEERAKQGFYRILWHYSDGNPTVALRFFRLSLNRNKETDQVVVRLFHAPESQELEKMPKPMLAVLRSIVQLEIASPEELSECTQLSISEVIGTLRYFQSRGFIEWNEDKARISDHWFRHITNVLDRQHLLVK
ncbi:ATP-binding protein [Vibrio aestuarianus]|uniref:AAA family ATPase n=1 Tax=Vibrio aestuarianus TaxID=28171 RepID=UPI00159341DC|nr:AAA family ATPase [Vibrio aestuarianus]NGZ16207.1 ATP-binding protein [Vibrio aestuarianus]